ncbi:hypothetical protein [Neobacillus sp. SAB-20_R2A]|uniref:hypothetical protein n=1 Tax=Neobacillus sp. SAB-20_R2A TaxID=3120519 RepID=UPI003C6E8178
MPRIEKVRIAGVRYDKMRKHYENTIFDFINESEPQHALLTLVNGGGKGALLQMIFQPLMPLTTWGKNGENHIDALFYNEKLQFDPYTFHVALEWRLDTDPAEWLMTGICVTARKSGQENDEVETEPQYFLYTSKYRKPEDWTIETLPLYDEDRKRSISYEEWEQWLKKHKQQFQFYSKSKQNAYFQYLSTYGIEKGEWRQMKEINRDEGGIEHYFKKGLDNFGLFHHLIIPEISAYLQEDQEENLIKIFRDNAIIAQKLPKLLKREEAYQLIQGKLIPIKSALEEGQSLETEVLENHDRANYLYSGMEEQKQTYRFDQEKWEEDRRKTEKQHADLLWQKDNLDYAKECRTFEEIAAKIALTAARLEELAGIKKELTDEKHLLELDIALKDYAESTTLLEAIEQRIKMLENAQNLSEEKEQMEMLERQLAENWRMIEKKVLTDIGKFNTLNNRLNKEIKVLGSQIDREQNDLNDIKSKLGTYTNYIQDHNQKAIHKEQKYGSDVNRDPESILRKLAKELQEHETAIDALNKESAGLQQRHGNVKEQLGENGAHINGKKEDLNKLQTKKAARLEEEKSFHKQWCRYYLLDQEFHYFSADDWIDIAEQLSKERLVLKQKYENLQKDYWYHQLDTTLLNDDYWIANNDVRKIVEKLAEVGVQATYGTQLIQELTAEEQALAMERYPLLAYGIVVYQQDWENEIFDADFQMLLTHAPVPIFIRERMNQEYAQPFEMAREQGISMAFHREKWMEWKNELVDLTDHFSLDLEKIDSKLAEVERMLETVKTLSVLPYQEILRDEDTMNGQLTKLGEQKRQIDEEIRTIEDRLLVLSNQGKQKEQERQALQNQLTEIEKWAEGHKKFLHYQLLKSEAQLKKAEMESRLAGFKKERDEKGQTLSSWEKSYHQWYWYAKQQTKTITEVLPEIEFPATDTQLTDGEELPQLRTTIFDETAPLTKSWHLLQQKINSVNSELAVEKERQQNQLQDQQKKRECLNQLDSSWQQREISVIPNEILKDRLKMKESELENSFLEFRNEEGNIKELNGEKKQVERNKTKLEQQILKNHHLSAEPWLGVNIEEIEQQIEVALKQVTEDLAAQRKIIDGLVVSQQKLQKQQDILKTHLHGLKQVGEIPSNMKESIKQEPEKLTQQWIEQNRELARRKEAYQKGFKERLKELSFALQDEKIDSALKQNMNNLIPQLESDSIRSGISVIDSVIEFIHHELMKLKDDKQKAENAQEIWVDRAVIRVLRIFQSLKQMVNRMKIKNKEGHMFPLVEIERLKEIETGDEEEYRRLLREHFTQTIEKLLENVESIETLSENQLKRFIDDSQLVLVSLRNRYPKLAIYKPQTTNAFLYEKPRKHHYTDWETLNKGSKMEAKGSGGQLLAARTMIMMMIMTFKRQESNKDWSVLITDNPFGQAVSAHILDPIFSIAEILRFQWIVLAPPELIKLDVSRRFPVYWKLELSQQKQGELIREVLQHGGRTFEEMEFSLF